MDKNKNNRSSKRQRSSRCVDKSSSDTELAQSRGKGRKVKPKEKWPLLEGLTVDELSRYRRRRIQGQPKDNLSIHPNSEDKNPVTEYCEAFNAEGKELLKENVWLNYDKQPVDVLQSRESIDKAQLLDEEQLKQYEKNETYADENTELTTALPIVDDKSISINELDDKTMDTETINNKLASDTNLLTRPALVRRGTTLKYEGEFYGDTETYSSYVAHEGHHRPQLARRPTSLKMEGDLNTSTEKCEKFIHWLNVSRPELMRVPTHLKLEGILETLTENHEKYIQFEGVRRPELLRQPTNLKLEGESTYTPEYASVFRTHDKECSQPVKFESHAKIEGNSFSNTKNLKNDYHSQSKEARLIIESNKDNASEEKRQNEQKEKQKKEEEMKILVSKLEDLTGPPLEIPEYKDAYKDFPRERPKIVKPEDEIGRADGTKISLSPGRKFSTKIDQDPEYKSKYLDYQQNLPNNKRPPLITKTALFPTDYDSEFNKHESKRFDNEFISEVKSQYIPYGRIPRAELLKMPVNLRLEGNLNFQPEYRTAYCRKYEHEPCTEGQMSRKRDRCLSASRRKENYWTNNNNIKQCHHMNSTEDQGAFQVLNTRVREGNTIGKPPQGSRRSSRTSQIQTSKLTQLDVAECKTRDESLSPTYRLHVCNVDDEPRGFRRRRSPSLQSSGRIRSPSPDKLFRNDAVRPYSPSFGKSIKQNNDQSFVVLDNRNVGTNKNDVRKRRTEQNYNIDNIHFRSKDRTKKSTNWMPPWYDNTNTI